MTIFVVSTVAMEMLVLLLSGTPSALQCSSWILRTPRPWGLLPWELCHFGRSCHLSSFSILRPVAMFWLMTATIVWLDVWPTQYNMYSCCANVSILQMQLYHYIHYTVMQFGWEGLANLSCINWYRPRLIKCYVSWEKNAPIPKPLCKPLFCGLWGLQWEVHKSVMDDSLAC